VGEIAIDPTDPQESTFTIQVSNRPYYLRAQDKTQCNDWVITLNRAREARMNVGNIQLHTPTLLDDPHRSQAGSDEYAPCIVISALRPRTHGSDLPPDLLTCHTEEEQQQIEVMGNWDHGGTVASPAAAANAEVPSPTKAMPSQEPPIMAKWQKKHTAMHTLSMRFLKWARSITKQADACRRETVSLIVELGMLFLDYLSSDNLIFIHNALHLSGCSRSPRARASISSHATNSSICIVRSSSSRHILG
jgi:hypothetical protein